MIVQEPQLHNDFEAPYQAQVYMQRPCAEQRFSCGYRMVAVAASYAFLRYVMFEQLQLFTLCLGSKTRW